MEEIPEDVGRFARFMLTATEREILQEEYDNAGETHNTDILIRWAIAAVMFPLNTALLLFALDRIFKGEFLGVVISIVAVIYVSLWYRLESRMEGLIQYWISKLIRIEDLLDPITRVTEANRALATSTNATHSREGHIPNQKERKGKMKRFLKYSVELIRTWLPFGIALGGLLYLFFRAGHISLPTAILTWIAGLVGDCIFIAYEEWKSNKIRERMQQHAIRDVEDHLKKMRNR